MAEYITTQNADKQRIRHQAGGAKLIESKSTYLVHPKHPKTPFFAYIKKRKKPDNA